MNGNFRVGWLVHLSIMHNMHQFVFAPTQALGGTNAQNIENQHFFSQIQSFQNDFKLYHDQLILTKIILSKIFFMFRQNYDVYLYEFNPC